MGFATLLGLLALGARGATASAPPRGVAPPTSITECRLSLVSIELGDHVYSTTSNITSSQSAWLCSPPDADPDDDTAGVLLYGDQVDQLDEGHSGLIVRLRDDGDVVTLNAAAVATAVLPPAVMLSFGDRMKRLARFVDLPDKFARRGRMLAPTAGGAAFVDRTRAHGMRRLLNVIVGVADAGGSRATWPRGCSAGAVRQAIWEGTSFTVGASPWSSRDACRRSDSCLFSVADHISHTSRGAVTFPPGTVVDLGTVSNYPGDFCNWRAIWAAVRKALETKGLNIDSFTNVIAYVPKHCAIAQGNQPGKLVIVSDADVARPPKAHLTICSAPLRAFNSP